MQILSIFRYIPWKCGVLIILILRVDIVIFKQARKRKKMSSLKNICLKNLFYMVIGDIHFFYSNYIEALTWCNWKCILAYPETAVWLAFVVVQFKFYGDIDFEKSKRYIHVNHTPMTFLSCSQVETKFLIYKLYSCMMLICSSFLPPADWPFRGCQCFM